jgi:hypothetical protein
MALFGVPAQLAVTENDQQPSVDLRVAIAIYRLQSPSGAFPGCGRLALLRDRPLTPLASGRP